MIELFPSVVPDLFSCLPRCFCLRELRFAERHIECMKSWARKALVYGAGSQIRLVEAKLVDLERQAAEMPA
jgi:hypothetical protein